MTEEEWLTCGKVHPMVMHVRPQASDRKFRLFACACTWHVEGWMVGRLGRHSVSVAERVADGEADESALARVYAAWPRGGIPLGEWLGGDAAYGEAWLAALRASTSACSAVQQLKQAALQAKPLWSKLMQRRRAGDLVVSEEIAHRTYISEEGHQAQLLRHIFGNPFRPYPTPDHWPPAAVQLAKALYGKEDCGFALHDALLEAGHSELADHFRQEQNHPKGCWVLDLILGKE